MLVRLGPRVVVQICEVVLRVGLGIPVVCENSSDALLDLLKPSLTASMDALVVVACSNGQLDVPAVRVRWRRQQVRQPELGQPLLHTPTRELSGGLARSLGPTASSPGAGKRIIRLGHVAESRCPLSQSLGTST